MVVGELLGPEQLLFAALGDFEVRHPLALFHGQRLHLARPFLEGDWLDGAVLAGPQHDEAVVVVTIDLFLSELHCWNADLESR